MKRRSGFGRLTVSLAVVLVLAGCGGKRNTYVMTPRYAADVYITLESSVPLPQDLLGDMKGGGGATFVGSAQGPAVCKYSRKIWATGPYRSVNGKRLTVEVNGSNRRTAVSYCARIRDRMRFNVVGFAGVSPKTGKSVVSAIGPVLMAPRQLSAEATILGTPFYWAGPERGFRYEFRRTTNGSLYVRYLPSAETLPAPGRGHLIVATYSFVGAYAALERYARGKAVRGPRGSIVFVRPARRTSVLLAFPNVDYEVEVYDPSPIVAASVALSGRIRPVSAESGRITPVR